MDIDVETCRSWNVTSCQRYKFYFIKNEIIKTNLFFILFLFSDSKAPEYAAPDGKLSFDLLTNLSRANTNRNSIIAVIPHQTLSTSLLRAQMKKINRRICVCRIQRCQSTSISTCTMVPNNVFALLECVVCRWCYVVFNIMHLFICLNWKGLWICWWFCDWREKIAN